MNQNQDTNRAEIFCPECGSKLLPDSLFCDKCGTKMLDSIVGADEEPKKNKISAKKIIKRIIFLVISIILAILLICGIVAGVNKYQEKQDSYDLSTGEREEEDYGWWDSQVYSYFVSNAEGENLTFSYYLHKNNYVYMSVCGDTIDVFESGIYEFNGNKLMLQTSDGEKTEYISYDGFLLIDTAFYNEKIPQKDTFNLDLTKEFPDGTKDKLTFKDDGTYTISSKLGTFKGKYTRDGYIIEGVCDDIRGSYTWLTYNDKLTGIFYEQGYGDSDKLKYECYKYLQTVAPDAIGAAERLFMREYKESHPITTN